jgi:four helix bundle protein
MAVADQPIKSFRDLEVWRLSMDLVDLVIRALKQVPREEFDLKRQIFRAVTSIPFNVAEGYRRKKRRAAYQNHVSIALGSQGELETAVEVCARNSFMTRETCREIFGITDRVGAMLNKLHDALDG